MVQKELNSINSGRNPIERWQNKIRHLRRFLKGWAKSMSGNYRKEKERLIDVIDRLDLKAETIPLSQAERATLKMQMKKITKLRRDEETKWG
jgi:hypothetical protein